MILIRGCLLVVSLMVGGLLFEDITELIRRRVRKGNISLYP